MSGCATPRVLAPRTAPPQQLPSVALPEQLPAAGQGRLVIDTTDGPMDVAAQRIESFTGAAGAGPAAGPLCRTPCVKDLPLGRYDLFLSGLASDPTRGDRAPVDVREGTNVLLRAPGKYEVPRAFQTGPFFLITGGVVLAAVSPAFLAQGVEQPAVTATMAVAGLAMLVAGLILYDYRPEQQAGTSTYFWQPPPAQ
ncbi:MAG: hypothetical protein ABW321_02740 [Polyangiales bacterium]